MTLAIVTIPGAPSRRPETEAVAAILDGYRPVVAIENKGTLDGGDVLQIGRTLYVGVSGCSQQGGHVATGGVGEAVWVSRRGDGGAAAACI